MFAATTTFWTISMMGTANIRVDGLLAGCVRASVCIAFLVLLAVTLWLPASSLAASFAGPGELGVSSADQANKAGYPENDSSPVGLVQGAVGVYSCLLYTSPSPRDS